MPHVTFIHGIANKPAAEELLQIWRRSLAQNDGLDLGAEGVSSSMIYWADVMYEHVQAPMAEHESNDSVIQPGDDEIEMDWQRGLKGDEKAWSDRLSMKLNFESLPPQDNESFAPSEKGMESLESLDFERIPLPWWLKRRLMKAYLRDVHHYLFNAEHSPRSGINYRVQDEIRERFLQGTEQGAKSDGQHVVVSHSMGTVVAYDCLKRVESCPHVDALMTIGSPLGLDEVQDKLQPGWTREDGFPEKVLAQSWVNVYDKLDPVAGFDPKLMNDYRRSGEGLIHDINEQNHGRWRHNISKYLGGDQLRAALAKQLKL